MAHLKYKSETRYVVGFAFSTATGEVLLLRKNRPEWQAGRWNGVGGHCEKNESFDAAMLREAREEMKQAHEIPWERYATLEGLNNDGRLFRCAVFRSFSSVWLESFSNDVGEVFSWHPTNGLPSNCINNLYWLIPLALDVSGGIASVRVKYGVDAARHTALGNGRNTF